MIRSQCTRLRSAIQPILALRAVPSMRPLLPLLLFVVGSAAGQTKDHVAIPGTKTTMIPPPGFVAATTFAGFQQPEKGASILIAEIEVGAENMANSLTESALASRGMKLLQKQRIDLHGTKATMLKVQQEANGVTYLKQMLVFGDEATAVLATGTYPASNSDSEAAINKALLSAYYNKQKKISAEPAVGFTVDGAGTAFKFAKSLAGSVVYTTDGKAPSEAADKAMIIIAASLGNTASGDQKQFSIASLQKLPEGQTNKIQSITSVTINGLSGYEIVATGKGPNAESQLVYQVLLFKSNGEYFRLVGLTDNKFEAHLADFKAVAQTLRAK